MESAPTTTERPTDLTATAAALAAPATGSAPSPTTANGFNDRVKAAKKTVVATGMRIGRTGAMVATAGVGLAGAAWKIHTPVSGVGIAVGLLAVVVGLIPFFVGWGLAKAGSPFLRALNEPGAVRALLIDAKALAGNRRSLSLLLNDGTRQTVALRDGEAQELVDVVGVLSPQAERGEREGAQRAIAQLMVV